MIKKILPQEFQRALPVLSALEQAGYEAYFVGGSVRDWLLKQPIHDVDIATSAFPSEIKEIFPRTIDVGIEHGTVLVLIGDEHYEITTFRTESEYQDYRRPDHVEFVRSLSEDLKRRDFTINALALKEDGKIIDLFNGIEDLMNQTLRAVGIPQERFHEDALRMMRGLRFVSQLGFQLEAETLTAIQENNHLLAKISVERVQIEFVKLLLGNYRNTGLKMLVASECYLYCPELKAYGEALLSLSNLADVPLKTEVQAWTLLLNQLDKKSTEVRPFLKKWKCSNDCIQQTQKLLIALNHRLDHQWTLKELYDTGLEHAIMIEELMVYFNEKPNPDEISVIYEALPIHSLKELAINGNDLIQHFKRPGGVWLKNMLAACEEQVLLNKLPNEKAALFVYSEEVMKD